VIAEYVGLFMVGWAAAFFAIAFVAVLILGRPRP
jgi:hypothetical protein